MRTGRKNEKTLLEDYLIRKLDEKNIFHVKGNPRNLKGMPDRIVYGLNIYFIELKLGKENNSYYKQTPIQEKWSLQINQTKTSRYFLLSTREKIDEIVEIIYNECIENEIKNYFAYDTKIT